MRVGRVEEAAGTDGWHNGVMSTSGRTAVMKSAEDMMMTSDDRKTILPDRDTRSISMASSSSSNAAAQLAASSSSLRDRDLAQWLENKFGAPDDPWNKTITSGGLLDADVLESLDMYFHDLQPQTKMRILLALFNLPPKSVEQLRSAAQNVLELAERDTEDWVNTFGQLLGDFCRTGGLCYRLNDEDSHFAKTLAELKACLQSRAAESATGTGASQLSLLPRECAYLTGTAAASLCAPSSSTSPSQSKSVLAASTSTAATTRHFTLKRRPKSATLRAELLNKAAESSVSQKSKNPLNNVTVPNRSLTKAFDDKAPLKAMPTANALKLSKGFTNEPRRETRPLIKREGGSKLIEIGETPQALRKKRKQAEAEQRQAERSQREEQKRREAEEREQRRQEANAAREAKIRAKHDAAREKAEATRAAMKTKGAQKPGGTSVQPDASSSTGPVSQQEDAESALAASAIASWTGGAAGGSSSSTVADQGAESSVADPTPDYAAAAMVPTRQMHQPTASVSASSFVAHQQQQPPHASHSLPQQAVQPQQQQPPLYAPQQQPQLSHQLGAAGVLQPQQQFNENQNPLQPPPPQQQQQPQQPAQQPPPAPNPQQPQQIVITPAVRATAQELFRTANRLTRQEKMLIIQFIAGNRANPAPHMGSIITLRLSDEQVIDHVDGVPTPRAMETFFQMDFNTGSWKKLKKLRPV